MMISIFLFLSLIMQTVTSLAEEERELPSNLKICTACHGKTGNSSSKLYPHLAGQKEDYLINQLIMFRNKTRNDPDAKAIMQAQAARLNDEDIRIAAEFFSSQKLNPGRPETPQLIELGKSIYLEGRSEREIPSCVACHGLSGKGKKATPRLAGQQTTYLIKQLYWFQTGQRTSESGVMGVVTKNLTREDMEALANFLTSLGEDRDPVY